nr:MAG TPA: leucine-rich repeat protein [Caudoviricetes sp.]
MSLWEILKAQKFVCSDNLFAQLAAEKLNGGRMPRNTIAIQHGAGTFKATAEGKNVVWQYGTQEIQGNTCEFTIAEDSAQILVSFDGLLTKFENKSDAQTLLDLSDLGGLTTNYISLYNCSNVTGDLSDLGGKITYLLNLFGCSKITGSLSDLGGNITHYLALYNCTNITGNLSDLGGAIDYLLNLEKCSKITGDLSDLGGNITYNLNLASCQNITGDLSDLEGNVSYSLNLSGCSKITGSLADLNGNISNYLNLYNCKNVTGIYSGNSFPKTMNLSYTGLTAADMDQTLINFNAGTTGTGKFTANGMTRTAASDDAVAGLTAKGWTVSGLTKIEG